MLNVRPAKHGGQEVYVTFQGQDKRLDTWISEAEVGEQVFGRDEPAQPQAGPSSPTARKRVGGGKVRQRCLRIQLGADVVLQEVLTPLRSPGALHSKAVISPALLESPASAASTPEREHAAMTRVRNFEDVRVGEYLIKTW